MNYRQIELHALETLAANKTISIDLDMQDPITQIIIDSRLTNGAEANASAHWVANMTNIEIVDGSDVLFSLDGYEMEALDIYHEGNFPRSVWTHYYSWQVSDRQIAINFGRWLWDEVLALDPKKFRNPKLNITIDYDAAGMSPSQSQISVLALVFDEKTVSPIGFLMSKEIKTWTTVDGDHEYTDLPTDYPYRKLLIGCRLSGYTPDQMFDNIKLSEDQDKKVVFNGQVRDLLFGIGRENAFIHEWIGIPCPRTDQRTFFNTSTLGVKIAASEWDGTAQAGEIALFGGDGGRFYGTTRDAACNATAHIAGFAPHGFLALPFGLQDKIEDWYDVAKIGSLKLDVSDGQDSGTAKLVVQQYRRY